MVALSAVCNPKQWPTISQIDLTEHGFPVYGANGQIGYYSTYNHEEPTVLITCRGATCGAINVCPPKSYVTGNAMALDQLDRRRVDLRYLVYALTPERLRKSITGSAQPQITRASLQGVDIPLPPVEEQRRIAAILDHADALRAKRREALARLDELSQSIFIDMFGGRDDFAIQLPLAEVVSEFRYGTSVKSSSVGDPVLRIPNVVGGKIDISDLKTVTLEPADFDRLQLRNGDLLFVRTNGNPNNVGRCAEFRVDSISAADVAVDRFVYASYLIRARVDACRVNSSYLAAFLNGPGRKLISANARTSAGQYNINIQGLSSVVVQVPALDRQELFVRRVEAIDRQKSISAAQLDELDALFASLQSRAFRGDL
ncbi:restriction endonuclease subunit S [Nocardia cyriacigeorgica]|nr:restriction endonuclease subunit S [Nocardia cyriacigeorgica]